MNEKDKGEFEKLLLSVRIPVERYIHFRMPTSHDAEDVIQETYLGAFQSFERLKNKDFFKTWILAIAKNQCALWFRRHNEKESHLTLDEVAEHLPACDPVEYTVSDLLCHVPKETASLLLDYADGSPLKDLAVKWQIPVGTVKSRLYSAKKHFRESCPPEIRSQYERGITMKNDFIMNFPRKMPRLTIEKAKLPFFEVRFEEECFIIPRIGNKNSEGTYRFGELALISTCTVRKNARIHEAPCVQINRDTFNVKADKLYKNECVWFAQLTEEYLRTLATIRFDEEEEDSDIPTEIHTFLEEDFDVLVNGNDRIHGLPLLLSENPAIIDENGIHLTERGVRYTTGVYHVTIGEKTFETVSFVLLQNGIYTEHFVTRDGKLLLMRWYQAENTVMVDELYTEQTRLRLQDNPNILVNEKKYFLVEERIGECAI